jgi:hypothetical protein
MELDSILKLSLEVFEFKKCAKTRIERFGNWKNLA